MILKNCTREMSRMMIMGGIMVMIILIGNFGFSFSQSIDVDVGMNYLKEENNEDAIVIFQQILLKEPENADALTGLGIAYANMKNYEMAIKYFDDALRIEPDNIVIINNKSLLEAKMSNYDNAINLADRVLTIDPDNEFAKLVKKRAIDSMKIDSWNKEALELGQQLELEKASKLFKEALEIDPNNIVALNNLGTIYGSAGWWNESFESYEKVLEIEPDNYFALYNIGINYIQMLKDDEAKEIFQKLLDKDPDNIDVKDVLTRLNNFYVIKSPYNDNSGITIFYQASIWDKNNYLISYTETDQIQSLYLEDFLKYLSEMPERKMISGNDPYQDDYFYKETEQITRNGMEGKLVKIHHIGTYLGTSLPMSASFFNPDAQKELLSAYHNAYFLQTGDKIHAMWSVFLPSES